MKTSLTNIEWAFFDLDGTITDPGMGITNSVAYALEKKGITPPEREQLYKFIGPPLADSFNKYFDIPMTETDEAIRIYREYFSVKGIFENEVYAGVREMLIELREAGMKICLATSKPEEFAQKILEHFGLSEYFDMVAGATMDGSRSLKKDVIEYAIDKLGLTDEDRTHIVMVGDREHDIIGAKQTELNSIGVTYGYGSPEELRTAGADFIADSPKAVAELILHEDKKRKLYDSQVKLLNTFLEQGAITKAQYDKSFGDLTKKMGY